MTFWLVNNPILTYISCNIKHSLFRLETCRHIFYDILMGKTVNDNQNTCRLRAKKQRRHWAIVDAIVKKKVYTSNEIDVRDISNQLYDNATYLIVSITSSYWPWSLTFVYERNGTWKTRYVWGIYVICSLTTQHIWLYLLLYNIDVHPDLNPKKNVHTNSQNNVRDSPICSIKKTN